MNLTEPTFSPRRVPQPRSEKQKAASPANGAKSRGPMTPEGKAISSRNSRRHGMLAKTILFEGESLKAFRECMRSLENTFRPATPYEISLTQTMAIARWRQMRLLGMEKAGLHTELQALADPPADPATRAFLAFASLAAQRQTLELMNRYESRCDRQYDQALARLLDSQRRRQAA